MTRFRIELPDGVALDGELTTVALAFLMHEYAEVAMDTEGTLRGLVASLEAAREANDATAALDPDGVGSGADDELADELANPEKYAHLAGFHEIGDDDGPGDQEG